MQVYSTIAVTDCHWGACCFSSLFTLNKEAFEFGDSFLKKNPASSICKSKLQRFSRLLWFSHLCLGLWQYKRYAFAQYGIQKCVEKWNRAQTGKATARGPLMNQNANETGEVRKALHEDAVRASPFSTICLSSNFQKHPSRTDNTFPSSAKQWQATVIVQLRQKERKRERSKLETPTERW